MNLLTRLLAVLTVPLLATSAGAQSTPAACAGQIVRDACGDVCVPKVPKRIVTID